MRISPIKVTIATLSLVAGAGTGTIITEALTMAPSPTTLMLQRLAADPAEDSPQFNCAKHGDEACGVSIDPTPNDGRTQVVRYVVQFDNGKAVSIKPFGR